MPRVASVVIVPSCVGMEPERRLLARFRLVRAARLPSCVGIEPEKLLPERSRLVREVSEPTCVGIEPVKLLLERSRLVRAVSRPIWVGRAFRRELLERSRLVRAVRLPISVGKLPERALLLRSSEVRARSRPICTGMEPETRVEVKGLGRLRPVTRDEPRVMPAQFCIIRCEGVPVPQERRKLPGRLLLTDTAAQWFCIPTRAWQSSTRSLVAPVTLGWSAVSTKVPSVQPEAARLTMSPTTREIRASCVSPPEEVSVVLKEPEPGMAEPVTVKTQPLRVTEVSATEMLAGGGSPQVMVKSPSEP